MKKNSGITLIELLIVLAITVLIVIVGLPSYNSYLIETRRHDGINTIRENQIIIDKYILENGITPTSGQVTLATTSPEGFYTIAYTRVSDERYKLVASAVGSKSQNNDTGCTSLTLISEMDNIYPADCR